MNDARRQKCQMRKDKIKTGWKLSDHKGPRVPHLVPVAKCMESKGEGEAGLVLIIPGNGTMAKKERKMAM